MPLTLQRAVESDIDRIVDIQFTAFAANPMNQVLFGDPVPPDVIVKSKEWTREDMRNPAITYMNAVDTERNNEIVGFAKWYIYRDERSESELNKKEDREWGEGTNLELANKFFGGMQESRKRNMGGKAHCC